MRKKMGFQRLRAGLLNSAAVAAGAAGMWAGAAWAQVDEIVVSAEKREESVQDVGIAISAVSGEKLREQKIFEPRDLFQRFPNVAVASNGTAGQLQFSIRGINFLSFSPISVQPVLVFQDDVVLNSPQAAGLFIFDLERVEVLRGPQNTLYGRNTTGGAVNFITRKPEIGGELNGYLDVSGGNYTTINAEGAVGGPIGDNAAFRIAVQSLHNNGYWENITVGDRQGERDQTMARAQLAFEPSDVLEVRLDVHGGVSNGGQRGIKSHGVFADAAAAMIFDQNCTDIDLDNLETSCIDLFENPTIPDNNVVTSDLANDRDDISTYGGSATINWDLGGPKLTSISAFEHNKYDHWEDADGIPLPFVMFRQKSDTDQWSQEFRLTSPDDGRFRWILGAFGFWENTEFSTAVPIALFDPLASFSDNNLVDHKTQMYSVFGKADFDITDRLTVTAGLRFVHEEKDGFAQYQFVVGLDAIDINDADAFLFENLVPFRLPGSHIAAEFGRDWGLWGGKWGLEYQASDDLMIYAHAARGEKAGQFTDAPDAIANGGFFTPAAPETVWSYEGGLKASWFDNRLITNLAVFYNDYENQQQQVTLPGPVSTVVNVASSTTKGIEFDAQLAPGDGWFADLSIGLLDTEVKRDSLGALTGGALSIRQGRELTNSPNVTVTGSIAKEWALASGNIFRLHVDARYTGERNFDLLEIAVDPVYVTDPSYVLVNALASYKFGPDQRFSVSAFGKNLNNATYFTLMQEFAIGNAILFTGNPRTWGVGVGVEF